MSDDFEIDTHTSFDAEPVAPEDAHKHDRILSIPPLLTAAQMEEKYRTITHETVPSEPMIFSEQDEVTGEWRDFAMFMVGGVNHVVEVTPGYSEGDTNGTE